MYYKFQSVLNFQAVLLVIFCTLPGSEGKISLLRTIRIGVLKTMGDRFSAFLSKETDNLEYN